MAKINYTAPYWVSNFEESYNMPLEELTASQQTKMNTIYTANKILDEYQQQGYQLTLRQLYYQFVARDMIANTQASYKKLGTIIGEGRMWGLIDWNQLVDRGRNFEERTHWDSPAEIIETISKTYSIDLWENSDVRFEVWVEKQALEDIVARACRPYDVGYLACKGYMSMSEMWAAAERIKSFPEHEYTILYLGDHDPSGIDMDRDIQDRLNTFGCYVNVKRIALNMDQVNQYNPPPNPAKMTDTRAKKYVAKYGNKSWELDALEPKVITDLIQNELKVGLDDEYMELIEVQTDARALLSDCSDNWGSVTRFLKGK